MVDTMWVLSRLGKFGSMLLFAGGVVTSVSSASRAERVHAAYGPATVGFVGSWVAGWLLVKQTGASIGEPWISASMLASLVALLGVFLRAYQAEPARWSAALAGGGLVASMVPMVLRASGDGTRTAATLAAFGLGGALAAWWAPSTSAAQEGDEHLLTRGFGWIAWAEGTSLVLMLFVSMPLRKLADIHLDGGTGTIGMTHGVLLLVYLIALTLTTRASGWGLKGWALGFVASVLPFGTFVFERRWREV